MDVWAEILATSPELAFRRMDDWFRLPFPSESVRGVLPHIHDERRTETSETSAAILANAWIDHTEGSCGEQLLRQPLRGDVALRRQAVDERFVTADVVEVRTEVREIVVIGHLFVEPANFGELYSFVKHDFRL